MDNRFVMPIDPYGEITIVLAPRGGVGAAGGHKELERVENALPLMSSFVQNFASALHEKIVRPMFAREDGAGEVTIDFALSFDLAIGIPVVQCTGGSIFQVSLNWKRNEQA